MIVYPARDIPQFVMYCVNGKPRSSLFIESTDSMTIYTMPLYTIPGEQEPKKVTAIQLYDMFSPCYSLEGSNAIGRKRWKLFYWMNFLEDCEGIIQKQVLIFAAIVTFFTSYIVELVYSMQLLEM